MPKFKEKDVVYVLEAEQDDCPVKGNAIDSGNKAFDKKVEDEIIRRLDDGDVWAWASVKVSARWNGIEGVDYLGSCSYKNEADFKQPGGYWEDMKATALDNLKKNILNLQSRVCGVVFK